MTTICGRKASATTMYIGREARKRLPPFSFVSCGGRRELII